MRDSSQPSEKAHTFLSPVPTDCRRARFYVLPKVHKPGNPGRLVISGICSPTGHISLFVDSFLKPLVLVTRGTHVGFGPMPTLDLVALYLRHILHIIWTSDEDSLTRFIDHMNSFHRSIKFTSEYSTTGRKWPNY